VLLQRLPALIEAFAPAPSPSLAQPALFVRTLLADHTRPRQELSWQRFLEAFIAAGGRPANCGSGRASCNDCAPVCCWKVAGAANLPSVCTPRLLAALSSPGRRGPPPLPPPPPSSSPPWRSRWRPASITSQPCTAGSLRHDPARPLLLIAPSMPAAAAAAPAFLPSVFSPTC